MVGDCNYLNRHVLPNLIVHELEETIAFAKTRTNEHRALPVFRLS